MTKQQRKESHSGFHFFNKFQNCMRDFYLNYICRLESIYKAPALTFGSAFHEAKAKYYTTGNLTKAQEVAVNLITKNKSLYEREEDYDKDLRRCPILLEYWINQFGKSDREYYNIISVEEFLEFPIPQTESFTLTGRIDAILEQKTYPDRFILMETKTSSFSTTLTDINVYYGDQATMYLWLAKKAYPKYTILGVQPDIAYWNRNAKDTGNISCYRGDLVTRSLKTLLDYELQMADLTTLISQRVNACYTKKFNAIQLFHRNTSHCSSFARKCEYADICRENITEKSEVPYGFKRRAKTKLKLTDFIGG